jgi:psiF repeat
MRALFTALMMSLLLGALPVHADTPTQSQTAQQQKMTDCNKRASDRNLTGDARQSFMKTCLSSKGDSTHTASASQQEKMKACNSEATAKNLTGDDRRVFINDCLKKH